MAEREGTLLLSNQTALVPANSFVDLEYPIAPGGIARIKSVTFKSFPDDIGDIDVSNVKLTRRGESQDVELTNGSLNIREYAGNGRLPRIWPVFEAADQNTTLKLRLTNRDLVAPRNVTMTHTFELQRVKFQDTEKPRFDERLLIFNQTAFIPAQQESRFVFTAPKLMDAKIKEVTHFVTPESDDIIVKQITLVRPDESEHIDLLDGTMDVRELAGDGELSRILETIELLRNREDLVMVVRNEEPNAAIRVSVTVWMILVMPTSSVEKRTTE